MSTDWIKPPSPEEWYKEEVVKRLRSDVLGEGPIAYASSQDINCEMAANDLRSRLSRSNPLPTTLDLTSVHFQLTYNSLEPNRGPGAARGAEATPVEGRMAAVQRGDLVLWEGSYHKRVASDLEAAARTARPFFDEASAATGAERRELAARAITVYASQLALIQPFADANRRVAMIVATVQSQILLGEDIVRKGDRAPGRAEYNRSVIAAGTTNDIGPACKVLTDVTLRPEFAKLTDTIDPCRHREISEQGIPLAQILKKNLPESTIDGGSETVEKQLPSGRSIKLQVAAHDPEIEQYRAASVDPRVDRYLQTMPNAERSIVLGLGADDEGRPQVMLHKECAMELGAREEAQSIEYDRKPAQQRVYERD